MARPVAAPAGDDDSSLEVTDLGGSDALHLLRQYIRDALLARLKGVDTGAYNHLVREMRQLKEQVTLSAEEAAVGETADEDDAEAALARQQLANMLVALSAHVSLLHERVHEALLSQVLGIQLWTSPQEVRAAALQLVQHLVLCSGPLMHLALRMLVLGLSPPPRPPVPGGAASPGGDAAWRPQPHAVLVQDQVIAVLLKVLALVPTAPTRLLPVLATGLPHKSRDTEAHCLALRGVFALAAAPAGASIREGLLEAVVDHLVELDVEIRWQDISERPEEPQEEEDEAQQQAQLDNEVEDMFELEGMTEELDIHGNHVGQQHAGQPAAQLHRGGWEGAPVPAQVPPAQRSAADEQAAKLDAMMELTLEHLEQRSAAGQAAYVWATLMAALDRVLLPTQRSKFTQFLLFYAARQEPERCSQQMLALLLARLGDVRAAPLTRSAAAAYAGSFLARAAFVPSPLVVTAVRELANWCWQYCREQDARAALERPATPQPPGSGGEQLSTDASAQHQVFFAAFQALLYVLCYHLEGLMQQQPPPAAAAAAAAAQQQHQQQLQQHWPDGGLPAVIRQLFQTVFPQLLAHRLAPLTACNATVVAEFARLSARLALLPAGAAGAAAALAAARAAGAAALPLEMFFPFDPYLLRRSARLLDLEETYVYWSKGHAQPVQPGDALAGASDGGSSDDELTAAEQSDDEAGSSDSDEDDEPRSLPSAAGIPRMGAPKRSSSAAFQPIVGFSAARQRSRSAEVARPGMPLGSAASSGPQQGSLSTDGTEALGASPWASSYGMSPTGGLAGGATGMSWAPDVRINGFLARAQFQPDGGA